MAARSKPPAAGAAATQAQVAAEAREQLAAMVPRALEFLGAAPGPALGGNGLTETISLPVAGSQTVLGTHRTRPNWYSIARKEIDKLARLLCERNWFARPVHDLRVLVYSHGFRFASQEANAWVAEGSYPFARYVKDMIIEWDISRAIVVWWKRQDGDGLPALNIPNNGDVDFEVIGGLAQITVRLERRKLDDSMKAKLGERLFEAIRKGKPLVIREDDQDFDFRVMKNGKSAAPFQVSPLVAIFDDLDFIEAIRIGDWNGAKARWEVIRQTKKGYAVTSGQNAGSQRTNAKPAELKAIVKAMSRLFGKLDIATNFDQEIGYVLFPKDHFHPDLLAEVKQRLLHHGGVFAVMLLKTDSQISGLGDFMMKQLRTEVMGFRDEFGPFVEGIFKAKSFRGESALPALEPVWSVKPLYSEKALNELITLCATYGLTAPQSLRGLFDLDDDKESKLMLEAHENPKKFTPPFEPRQGISAGFSAPPEETGGNQRQTAMPGAPGRPEGS